MKDASYGSSSHARRFDFERNSSDLE
jgi:hypothetical protein